MNPARPKTFLSVFAALLFSTPVFAIPTVTVLSPSNNGTAGAPVYYEAYATSSGCAKGISAMRIYSAPGVNAYTANGAHIETFIQLQPGTYNTVVQAWDNCGGVGKTNVTIDVGSSAGVTVFHPSSGGTSIPNHIAASAQNLSCAQGINAMRIYTANGTTPYTVHSNQLNAFVNLLPGTYDFTVQAWDNCGNVFKSSFSKSLSETPDGYVYALNQVGPISELQIQNGVLKNPNGTGLPPQFSAGTSPSAIAVDPGGWFLYEVAQDGIYGFQIDQNTGALVTMPGSPFPGKNPKNSNLGDITVDPNGNFVFVSYDFSDTVAAYKVDRSTGALTNTATIQLGSPNNAGVSAVSADFSGQYLYAIQPNISPSMFQIFGYKVDQDTGGLTSVAGSPFVENGGGNGVALSSTQGYLYAADTQEFGSGGIFGFAVNFGTGTLTATSGSPYPDSDETGVLVADDLGAHVWTINNSGFPTFQPSFATLDILNGGSLGDLSTSQTPGSGTSNMALSEDHSGKYLYEMLEWVNSSCPNNCSAVASFAVGSDGQPSTLSGPIPISTAFPSGTSIVATRRSGD